jgi:hypothetical protein
MERNRLSILQNIADITRRSRDIIAGRSPEIAANPPSPMTIPRPSFDFPDEPNYALSLQRLKVPRYAAERLNEAYDGKVDSLQATLESEANSIWETLCYSRLSNEDIEERFNCIMAIHLKTYTIYLKTYTETIDRLYTSAVEIVLAQLRAKNKQKPKWNKVGSQLYFTLS